MSTPLIPINSGLKPEYLTAGASAIIYAIDEHLVLKNYFAEKTASKEQECRALERLSCHPHIVRRIFTTPVRDDAIVIQRGECLRNIINRRPLPPLSVRISYANQAAIGLDLIHKQEIVHADVGLHNMIVIDGQLAIIDFEGCLIDGKSPAVGARYEWCSYKLSRNEDGSAQVNVMTDIFAYGCTLYELMAGKQPHHDLMGDPATDGRALRAEKRWENSRFPDVAGLPFGDVMVGCWKSQYPSMQDVIKALNTSLERKGET